MIALTPRMSIIYCIWVMASMIKWNHLLCYLLKHSRCPYSLEYQTQTSSMIRGAKSLHQLYLLFQGNYFHPSNSCPLVLPGLCRRFMTLWLPCWTSRFQWLTEKIRQAKDCSGGRQGKVLLASTCRIDSKQSGCPSGDLANSTC